MQTITKAQRTHSIALHSSSIHNGGSGTDPPLGAVLDPMAAPTIVSEMHIWQPQQQGGSDTVFIHH